MVGPSGCGKSTLLRLVAGLAHVDAGRIRIGDAVVDDGVRRVDPELRHTGLVFQEHALFPHLTVADNIAFGLRGVSACAIGPGAAPSGWTSSGCPATAAATRTSCRAASASGSRWPAPSPPGRA